MAKKNINKDNVVSQPVQQHRGENSTIPMQSQRKTGCTISLPGCLYLIILIAATTIVVKECKRSDLRLKREKLEYKSACDSINNLVVDTLKQKVR